MKNTAVILINCPDRKGIVASVADFLYRNNANILHADEHKDSESNLFFLRVEWELDEFKLSREEFYTEFSKLAHEFSMQWQVAYSEEKQNVAVCVSKEEHCLADLLYRYKSGELYCNIKVIISNHENAAPLARFYDIPFQYIPTTNENRTQAEKQMLTILQKNKIDLAILARYMRILSEEFVNTFANPVINIHHSFLPAFIGAKPYQQAYQRGVKLIGATAHYVTPELDQGPIIDQDVLRVSHRDNVSDLIQKGKDLEKIVLSRAVKNHLQHRVLTYANKTVIFD